MLNLYIKSFSYKSGLPAAMDSHGGGFVFDCRALTNPGREQQYKTLTGQDVSVQAFIESQNDSAAFWEATLKLVQLSVDTYKARGFDSLSVYFGCTGGQHRSVYFAEKLAKHCASDEQIKVSLEHKNIPLKS